MRTRASLVAVLLLVAACGGTTSSPAAPASAATTPAPGAPSPAAPTPAPASPAAAAACPEEPEPTGTPCFEVVIDDFAFDPPSLVVPIVARVVFINNESAPHSIQWSDGAPTSASLATGETAAREFLGAPAGTIGYVCGIHGASMSGEIVIDDTLPVP